MTLNSLQHQPHYDLAQRNDQDQDQDQKIKD